MASTSNSISPPSSPPPPPPPPPPQASLRNPFPSELLPPTRDFLEERPHKRRRIKQSQKKSLINNFELQPHVTKILRSNDFSSLLETIQIFIQSKDPSFQTVFKSLAHHYPNAFAFKLAKLLETHPKLEIRNEAVSILLHIFKKSDKWNPSMLNQLKEPLINSLKKEYSESLFQPLCETIGLCAARVYQYPYLGGWIKLLQYVCDCFSGGNVRLMKGLIMLAEFPEEVVENREFWLDQGNFDAVYSDLLKFAYSQKEDLQELTFNASLTVMKMSKDLERTEVCDSLLPILLGFIDLQDGEDKDLPDMLKQLENLVTLDIETIFYGKEGDVFWCMIRVAEMEDASEELRSAAVTVIKELDEANSDGMESVVKKFSPEEVKRVFSVIIDMMSHVVDDPVWYDVDDKNCKDVGLIEDYNRGKFLLNLLSFDGDERVFVPIAIEMIESKYAVHSDWRVRYAAMLAIDAIADKNFKGEMISYIHQALTLVHKSLNDMNPRVLWATMHAIKCLSEYKEILKDSQFHLKFLAKLISIIKVSLRPRVQFMYSEQRRISQLNVKAEHVLYAQAVIAIRFLVTNCGLEKIFSVGEEIIVLLLKLLKHEKQKLQEEALETLKPVAVLMPAIVYQNHYDTTMAALQVLFDNCNSPKLLLIRSKCLECVCTLVKNCGRDKIKENEVDAILEALISIEGNLSNTDHLTSYVILKVYLKSMVDHLSPLYGNSGLKAVILNK
ncbi:importin subunit beta-3 [Medicago truncatula]|uniref:importin subunit beta-3 n=1 Tax=Medicago truncatula TaxID=3880 RepID=UPI001967CB4E|nr:importin subunit beta-3 [Medicago truncatula]